MLNEFNEGGAHEQNPLGGIPQGMDQNGQLNTVEENETKKDNFIYSDRIKLTPELVSQFNLPKILANKTAAEATKIINNKFEGRNSTIDNSTKKAMLDRIAEAQETVKQIEAQKQAEIAEALNINSTTAPEDQMGGEIPQGMEEFLPQEQMMYGGKLRQNQMFLGGNQMMQDPNQNQGSGMGVGNLGGMFSSIGNGLNTYAKQRDASKMPEGYVDKKGQQDEQINQVVDSTKDGVASMFGPMGQMFRGIQKTGQGIGNAIGGDAGAAVSGIFSPEEGMMAALTDKDLSIGQKALATIPGVGGVIAKRQADKRLNKWMFEKDTLEANSKISNFAFGGNMYNDGGGLTDPTKPWMLPKSTMMDDPNYQSTGPEGLFKTNIPRVDSSLPKKGQFYKQSFNQMRKPLVSNEIGFKSKLNYNDPDVVTLSPEQLKETGGYSNPELAPENVKSGFGKTLNKVGQFTKDNYGNILRYSPVAMNALQLHKLNKSGYDTVNPTINNTRYNPQYMDEKALVNQINAESNYAGNSLANASNGSMGALRSNILASQSAKTKGLSDAYSRVAEVNRNENKTGQQFNLGIDEANIARRIDAEDKTAMNKGNWETNKSRLLGQIGTDLGNIGLEQERNNMAEAMTGYTRRGKYLYKDDGTRVSANELKSTINNTMRSVGVTEKDGKYFDTSGKELTSTDVLKMINSKNTTNQNRFGGYIMSKNFKK